MSTVESETCVKCEGLFNSNTCDNCPWIRAPRRQKEAGELPINIIRMENILGDKKNGCLGYRRKIESLVLVEE